MDDEFAVDLTTCVHDEVRHAVPAEERIDESPPAGADPSAGNGVAQTGRLMGARDVIRKKRELDRIGRRGGVRSDGWHAASVPGAIRSPEMLPVTSSQQVAAPVSVRTIARFSAASPVEGSRGAA